MARKTRSHEMSPHLYSRYTDGGQIGLVCEECGSILEVGDRVITRSNKHNTFVYCPWCAYHLKMLSSFGAVSFSGVTKRGAFYNLILNGEKRQTIREPMKKGRLHVKVDHTFNLYWRMRMSKAEKKALSQPHRLGVVLCTAYDDVTLADMWWDKENATADGFIDLDEFRDWFDPTPSWRGYRVDEDFLEQFPYKRIKWDYPLLERG